MIKPLTACVVAVSASAATALGAGPQIDSVCPNDKSSYTVSFGAYDRGEATQLCSSNDEHLVIKQKLQVAPTLPFIRVETWAHTTMINITELTYNFEGRVTAIVPGGQNTNTWRTYIFNYTAGNFGTPIDERASSPFTDVAFTHTETTNAPDHVDTDGEIRMMMDAFDPGIAVNAQWRLFIDQFSVDVTGDRP
jgi:hypothetical protein